MGDCDHDEGLVDDARHDVKREALKRKPSEDAVELGVQDGGARTWKFLCAPNGILVRIEKDETEAMTLLVVPFSSEVELTLGLPKQLKGKH